MIGLSLVLAGSGYAQSVQFAQQRGPYYVGEPALVQVIASEFPGSDQVECSLKGAILDGIEIEGPQIGNSSSSVTQIVNGRMSRKTSITHRFSFVVTANREGQFEIGPFEVSVNGEKETVSGSTMKFERLEPDPNMEIAFSIEREKIYAGEKVPVKIRWAYAGDINDVQYAFSNLQIRSPLFDQFSFLESPRQQQTQLTLATAKGGIEVDAVVTQEEKDGEKVIVVTGEQMMIADSIGKFENVPITCRTKRVSKWGRNIFRDRVATATAPSLAAGKPLSFVVSPVPISGQPESYSGAVGNGFSVNVTANRSVVRIGDPITFDIELSGDGVLSGIRLPDLEAMGLSSDKFQSQPEMSVEPQENGKVFSTTIRVKNLDVNQIPALSFSWFDPRTEKFETTQSKPIAIQVLETKMVSATEVVSGAKVESKKEDPAKKENSGVGLSLAGANLAIETNVQKLSQDSSVSAASNWIPASIYVLAIVTGLFVMFRGQKSEDDIAKNRLKTRLSQIKSQVQSSSKLSGKPALEKLSSALRDFIREFEPTNRPRVEQLISKCENMSYSPSNSSNEVEIGSLTKEAMDCIKEANL